MKVMAMTATTTTTTTTTTTNNNNGKNMNGNNRFFIGGWWFRRSLLLCFFLLSDNNSNTTSFGFVPVRPPRTRSVPSTRTTTTQLAFDLWNQQKKMTTKDKTESTKIIQLDKNNNNDNANNEQLRIKKSSKEIATSLQLKKKMDDPSPEKNNNNNNKEEDYVDRNVHDAALLLQSQPQQDDDDDDTVMVMVDRYKNRAALTEAILKEKVQELNLLQSKMMILQDVVNRIQMESKQSLEQQEKTYQERLALVEKELDQTKQRQQQQQWMNDETAIIHEKVVKDLEQKLLLQQEQDQQDTKDALQEAAAAAAREKQVLERQIQALQMEVLDMDSLLETTQGELQKVQRQFILREETVQSREVSHTRQVGRLERKVKELEMDLDMAQRNATTMNQRRMESIEIAAAAVRAAEAREAKVQVELNEFQKLVSNLRKEQEELKASMMSSKTTIAAAATTTTVVDPPPTKNQDPKLQARIQELETKLEQERLLNDANRKLEMERFEVRLSIERRKHEQEVQRLQDQLLLMERSNNNKDPNSATSEGRKRLRRILTSLQSIIN